jgi:hypothetical protein
LRLPFNGSYRTNQPFGVNPGAYARFGLNGHDGIDYNLPSGTPVVAAIEGIATVHEDPSGFGHYVTVQNANLLTLYGHLQGYAVGNGQHVQEGQVIAWSNNSGNSTGPHLHFGVMPLPYKNNGYGGFVDPLLYLNAKPQGDTNMASLASEGDVDEIISQLTGLRITSNGNFKSLIGKPWPQVFNEVFSYPEAVAYRQKISYADFDRRKNVLDELWLMLLRRHVTDGEVANSQGRPYSDILSDIKASQEFKDRTAEWQRGQK